MIRTALFLAVLPVPLAAHPHVFVEATVEIVAEAGAVTGIRLTWVYDDFFSFVLTSELGLDPDGDMVLQPDELQALSDFVLDWPADFGGDLHVTSAAGQAALAAPVEAQVSYADGRVTEVHLRPLAEPVPAAAGAPVTVQVFDPYYYTAYEVVGAVVVTGDPSCRADLALPDLEAAYATVDGILGGRAPVEVGPDEEFPPVGHLFADAVTVQCGG